ncbi:MAG: cytochrome c peroxidase [Bryobacteraceae bacterium]|nr:cytochrome c peroxidase [Bryobacteraceae bacterium]
MSGLLWLMLAQTPRLVWSGPEVNLLGAPSPDGRWLSYVEAGDLAIRDLATGASRRLTSHAPKQFAYFSVFSPDSRTLAYAWMNEAGFYDLRVLGVEGGEPKVVFRNEEAGFVQPCAFTPDGKQILTLLFRRDNISQIAMVPVDGSSPRILKSLSWVYPKKMDLSPDGRTIVYDNFAKEGAYARAIYLLDADGGRERRWLDAPDSYLFPIWTPDGRELVYAVESGESVDLWLRSLDGARARLLLSRAGRVLPMGVTRAGVLYFGRRRAPDEMTGIGSPQNGYIAFIVPHGTENYAVDSRAILLTNGSGERRELTPLPLIEEVWWLDKASLLARGADKHGRSGLFRVDIATGSATAYDGPPPAQPSVLPSRSANEVWAIDLESRPKPPLGLDAYVPVPESNPLTRAKVSLGRALFEDKRLSRDGTVSCATCHRRELAFTDANPLAVGIGGQTGTRRTPRIANRAWGTSFFWDGRAKTLEEQVLEPIANPKEMGLAPGDAAARVGTTVAEMRDVLASYVRTILAGDSPYDRYVAGDKSALTALQQEGLKLFRGKAGCIVCHLGPNLTDEKLHAGIKTPSLRDVARTPPYRHDGSLSTLREVIEHYSSGRAPGVAAFQLDAGEKAALVALIESFNGAIVDGLP